MSGRSRSSYTLWLLVALRDCALVTPWVIVRVPKVVCSNVGTMPCLAIASLASCCATADSSSLRWGVPVLCGAIVWLSSSIGPASGGITWSAPNWSFCCKVGNMSVACIVGVSPVPTGRLDGPSAGFVFPAWCLMLKL
jgi:hypothetical protein